MISRLDREFGSSHILCTFYESGTDAETGTSTTLVERNGRCILFATSAGKRVTVLGIDDDRARAELLRRKQPGRD